MGDTRKKLVDECNKHIHSRNTRARLTATLMLELLETLDKGEPESDKVPDIFRRLTKNLHRFKPAWNEHKLKHLVTSWLQGFHKGCVEVYNERISTN